MQTGRANIRDALPIPFPVRHKDAGPDGPADAVEWIVSTGPVAYQAAVATMEKRIAGIAAGSAPEAVWLLEHPPL